MDIFISWAEERSKIVAEALKDWLKLVIQNVDPWMSSADIRAGSRWLNEISDLLSKSRFGILCLTPEALQSMWLHFEAGALAKTIDNSTFVCPYLIGIDDPSQLPMPLAQFQSKRADRDGTLALIKTINSAFGEAALSATVLEETFAAFWPKLEKVIKELPPTAQPLKKRQTEEILQEILSIVRGLPKEKTYEEQERIWARWVKEHADAGNLKVRTDVLTKLLDQELREEHGIRALGDKRNAT